MTPLEETVAQLHELYRSMVEAGFTENEAMTIIAKCIAEQNK